MKTQRNIILLFLCKLLLIIFFIIANTNCAKKDHIALKEINGEMIFLKDLKGQWVFINYWASWCQPCLDEIKVFNDFYKKNQQKIALFAVNFDMLPIKKQLQLIKKYQIQYPSLQEDPAELLELHDIPGLPVTFVFNPQGVLKHTLYGSQTVNNLNKIIAQSRK